MRESISSNHLSFDLQVKDAVNFLTATFGNAFRGDFDAEFPEWDDLAWDGAWIDPVAAPSADYSSWVCDWLEANTIVYWEDGEPWVGSDNGEDN